MKKNKYKENKHKENKKRMETFNKKFAKIKKKIIKQEKNKNGVIKKIINFLKLK